MSAILTDLLLLSCLAALSPDIGSNAGWEHAQLTEFLQQVGAVETSADENWISFVRLARGGRQDFCGRNLGPSETFGILESFVL